MVHEQQGIAQQESDLNRQHIDLAKNISQLKQDLYAVHPNPEKFQSAHRTEMGELEQMLQTLPGLRSLTSFYSKG